MKHTRSRRFGDMPRLHTDRYGLRYGVFYNERHGPHVAVWTGRYGSGYSANISLWDLSIMAGALRSADERRAKLFVGQHLDYFRRAWNLARQGRPIPRLR